VTLQSEFHETIATFGIGDRAHKRLAVEGKSRPTWAPQTAPVSVNKNPPQTVRIMFEAMSISLSNSSHFPVRDGSKLVNTVVLPPGHAMLATRPLPTGSGG
jgi:hypothetical protein